MGSIRTGQRPLARSGSTGSSWLRVHAGPASLVDCELSGTDTLVVRTVGGSSSPVVITTNAVVHRVAAGSLRLGDRARVDSASRLAVGTSPTGPRIGAEHRADPVVIAVDRAG